MAVTLNASTSSGFIQTADTSGTVEIQSNGTTKFNVASTGAYGQLVSGTAVASTSGTAIDFTSIPSWVKRVTVVFNEVSTNGSSGTLIQIGTSSGVVSSGYLSTSVGTAVSAGVSNYTTGFGIRNDSDSYVMSGHMVITNISGNIWISSHTTKVSTAVCPLGAGSVTLGNTLDRIRFTTVNGTDTFDAGSINILYEG
jgi:hypothetical protein